MTVGIGPGMPVNNNRNQGVDSTEVIENYGKITGGAHNFGKIADSVIYKSQESGIRRAKKWKMISLDASIHWPTNSSLTSVYMIGSS